MGSQTRGPWSDKSILSLQGSASQQLVASDPNRQGMIIANPNATAPVSFTILATAAATTGGNITINASAAPFIMDEAIATNAIQVIGSAGASVTCWTFP